jgi:hypothetical protein
MLTLNLTQEQVQLIWTSIEEWQKQLMKTDRNNLKMSLIELQEHIEMQINVNKHPK